MDSYCGQFSEVNIWINGQSVDLRETLYSTAEQTLFEEYPSPERLSSTAELFSIGKSFSRNDQNTSSPAKSFIKVSLMTFNISPLVNQYRG